MSKEQLEILDEGELNENELVNETEDYEEESPETVESESSDEEDYEEENLETVESESSDEEDYEEENPETVESESDENEEEEVVETTSEAIEPERLDAGRRRKKLNVSISTDEFDWDAFEESSPTGVSKSEVEQLYNQTLSKVAENEIVEGTVTSMNKREVIVNIGYKSEGVINISEFRYNPDLKVGDKVEVYVQTAEDKKGQLLISHKQARSLRSWDRVNEAMEKDEIVKGFIKCRTKGGMIVDVFGIEAFLPGSQIDVKPIRDYDVYVGKNMEFKIVKITQEFSNVVVSHKALIEAELEAQKSEIISRLEKGQVLEGTVKNITSYGVFIDLGGVDGLIHITDLSWGRVNHPEEIVALDQKINVVILDFDDSKKRIALGIKQLTPHPWDSLDSSMKVGDVVKGKVVVMADYGAFVEIAPGVEGLIHVSEMSWSQHLRSAQDFMKVGDEVEAMIITLDKDERKMSLGVKQLRPDPWVNVETKYPVGSHHIAKVRNFTNFGVFVEIEEGVDGLIHISDLSWTKRIPHPNIFTSIGADIDVVVLEIDMENRRLSLGHKQLEENPWEVFEKIFLPDSVHEGTIIELSDKGAIVALPYGVEGNVMPRQLVKENGATAKLDEKLPFKVIEFNKNSKKIVLSHTRTFEDAKQEAESNAKRSEEEKTQKAIKKLNSSMEKTTLGDISEFAALKEEMRKDKGENASAGSVEKVAKSAENVAESVENVAESVENVAESVENVAENVENVAESVENVAESVENVAESVENVIESVEDTTESVEDTTESVENVAESVEDANENVENVAESVEDATESVEDTTGSIEDAAANVEDTVESVENVAESVENTEDVEKNIEESTENIEDSEVKE
jgi:small subunit ribosomal protein S1